MPCVRPYRLSDRCALTCAIDAVCGEGRWMTTDRFEPTPMWLHALEVPGCHHHRLLVVENATSIVGWCRMFPRPHRHSDGAELGVALLPAYRDRGIGTALVLRSLAWAEAAGFGRAVLTTHAENARARRVFSRCGFVQIGAADSGGMIEMICDIPSMHALFGRPITTNGQHRALTVA